MYVSHLGFPVAAAKMEFAVRDGIYTTINLADDLNAGNSHFYAEVLRVKKVAKELGADKNLFVIFDELFGGTNVKDAYEGTVSITAAFAEKHNCMFVISTHIIEAGEILKATCRNINFVYLPTTMEGNTPPSSITNRRQTIFIVQKVVAPDYPIFHWACCPFSSIVSPLSSAHPGTTRRSQAADH